jgi:DnaJ-domain-containing protein 1
MDRLGTVLKSYLHTSKAPKNDPDLDAAYEELDDFLKRLNSKTKTEETPPKKKPSVPKEIQQDFEELGLSPDAGADECKEAYKKLLKLHHPDRHAKHEANMKKATEKTARVNAAYERLVRWFRLTR